LGNGDLCGRNAWAQGPIAGTQQKYPRDFNLFTLGDATNFPDVAGAAAVGGQFTASSFSLNFSGYAAVGLVDSGLAQLANGKVSGSIYSPNLATFPTAQLTTLLNSVTVVNGSSTQTTSSTQVIEFANAFVNLRNMSQVLKLYTNTPPLCVLGACIPTVVIGSDTIVITGTRADLVVATIDSAKLSAVSTVNINIGPGTRLIVNVTGGSASFGPMQVNWKNGTSNILWNFPDATEIDMKAVRFGGSVLAPNAVVKFDWGGDIVGTLVAKSAGPLLPSGQSFQLHSMPFPWPM
jgi:choice-of-anchor A domain-containing protein